MSRGASIGPDAVHFDVPDVFMPLDIGEDPTERVQRPSALTPEPTEPPPSWYALLTAELRAAVGDSVLDDMTPYDVLSDEQVAEVAARTGWCPGALLDGTAPRMTFERR